MFILAERTQRRLARLLFLLGCLAPTLVVVAWSVYRQTSTEAARYEATLSATLGTQVIIERVWHPKPGMTVLDRLSCRDPLSGSIWAKIGHVRIDHRPPKPDIELVRAELIVEEPDSLATIIARMLPTRPIHQLAGSIRAERMTVHRVPDGPTGDLPLAWTVEQLRLSADDAESVRVDGQLDDPTPMANGARKSTTTRFTVICRRGEAWSPQSQPTQPPSIAAPAAAANAPPLAAKPNILTTRKPTCTITLKTHDGALPVYLFAPGLARQLGPTARFEGTLQTSWTGRQRQLTCEGRLTDWHLQRPAQHWSHHGLWGTAELRLDDCRLTNDRLTQVRGQLRTERAEASQHLADDLAAFWPTSIGDAPQASTDELPELVWDFEIDTHRSLMRVNSEGRLRVRDRPGASLSLAGTLERPLSDWVRLMVPATDRGFPVTAQTLPYLQHLQWPAHTSTSNTATSETATSDAASGGSVAEPVGSPAVDDRRPADSRRIPVVRLRGAGTWK